MSRPILCIGTYAKTPYHIEKVGKNVYCIEELCYILVNNAFLLDEDSFDNALFDWIEKGCSLERLADELRNMALKKCSAAALAGTILDYVGCNTKKEVDRTEEILRANSGMDVYKKKMARAEFLLKNNRYSMAFKEYEFLLKNTDDIDKKTKALIEHNEGVMYARMFLFERAASMFLQAYKDGGNRESYIQYLGALRMNLSNEDYVSFVADNDEAYEPSLSLERKLDELGDLFGSSKLNHTVGTLSVYKAEGKMYEYYNMVGEITEDLKTEYRDLVKGKIG